MRNAIPFYKVGGTILFKREELIRFVESGLINENRDDIDGFDLLSPFQEAA
jgi:hypothetical protein